MSATLTATAAAPAPNQKKLISRRQLAVELDIHVCTVDRWKKGGAIPFVRLGRIVRFDLLEVVEHLKNHFGIDPLGARS